MSPFYKIFSVVFLLTFWYETSAQVNSQYADKFKQVDSLNIGFGGNADEFITDFINDPAATAEAISKYNNYKSYIDSVCVAYKIPTEVGILILAASNANVFYQDKEGNSGPWAMQYKVARMYGLKMNTYVDERRDIEKTTEISAKFLKELFIIYDSWSMAFAAYTTSTLTVNKYIRLSGNNFNYWEMYDSLPQAAQDIVPAYIAATYIYNYYADHNISPKPYRIIAYDTLTLDKWMSFDMMASTLRTSVPVLQTLNPTFKKGVIPVSARRYILKLPKQSNPWFSDLDTLSFKPYNTNPYVEENKIPQKNLNTPKGGGKVYTGSDTIYHKVNRGQGLGIIAQKYGVSVDNIRKWNKMRGYMIHPNQRLMIIMRKE